MFDGDEYQKNLTFVETIQAIATRLDVSLSSLVLAWTMGQQGITTVLFGATNAEQVATNAKSLHCKLDHDTILAINQAIQQRGTILGSRRV